MITATVTIYFIMISLVACSFAAMKGDDDDVNFFSFIIIVHHFPPWTSVWTDAFQKVLDTSEQC